MIALDGLDDLGGQADGRQGVGGGHHGRHALFHGPAEGLGLLAQALVREWIRAQTGSQTAKPLQEPPAWLLAGLARQIGGEHRLEDLDVVQAQWLHGRLPPLVELLG